jgi:hypothetical protein
MISPRNQDKVPHLPLSHFEIWTDTPEQRKVSQASSKLLFFNFQSQLINKFELSVQALPF